MMFRWYWTVTECREYATWMRGDGSCGFVKEADRTEVYKVALNRSEAEAVTRPKDVTLKLD